MFKNFSRIFICILFTYYFPLNLKLIAQPLFSMQEDDLLFADKNTLKKDQVKTIEMRGIGFKIKDAIQDLSLIHI